jgi:hypothetical protein
MSLDGMSGKFVEMSVQVAPASFDSKTWPRPAPGPSENFRENPLTTTNRSFSSFGLIAAPWRKRFGKPAGKVTSFHGQRGPG